MPNLFAMSFEGELAPSFTLRCLEHGGSLPDGWGIGYYPGGEPSAPVLKEPAPPPGSIRGELVRAWEHLESSLFVLHIRRASWGKNSDANTQPFCRSYGGRDWLIAHAGSLRGRIALSEPVLHEPVGATDTELVFCEILNRMQRLGKKSLGDVEPERLQAWLGELNQQGSLSLVLTDGRDLVAYADRYDDGALHLGELWPPYGSVVIGDDDLEVNLTRRAVLSRKGLIVASSPLYARDGGHGANWRKLAPGSLTIMRQGAIRSVQEPLANSTRPSAARIRVARPAVASTRTLAIEHRTTYRYGRPVERSEHMFRLKPIHDLNQTVISHEIFVSVEGKTQDYEDVFGNRVRKVRLETPFTELTVFARSLVKVDDPGLLGTNVAHMRSSIPLVWMPWQHHMLQPYLLPPELPETQLRELARYAMSFVERNDFDLLDTLLDLNQTLYREYAYVPGSTTLLTTPFQTYVERRGVCQDFANLFICLARLLAVPARYVCGYVHTHALPFQEGTGQPNQHQGEASHAWVQTYLPEVGWRSFDPTNGIVPQGDHVRVAIGRNYVDATPTSGTLYVGGGGETLEVDVRVTPRD